MSPCIHLHAGRCGKGKPTGDICQGRTVAVKDFCFAYDGGGQG